MLWHLQSYTYLFYVLCPKLALIGKKIGTNMFENWHQYIYNLRQYIEKLAPIYLQFTHFFHLCHTNLQVMTPGVEDRVQTLSLGLEAPPFEGVFWLSSLTSTINYWIAILKKTQLIRSGLPRARAPQVRAARQSSSSRPSSSDPPALRNKLGRSRPSSITGLPRWWKEIVLH